MFASVAPLQPAAARPRLPACTGTRAARAMALTGLLPVLLAGLLTGLLAAVPAPALALEAVPAVVTEARFDRPHDVLPSEDGRLLYVADLGHDAVAVLDAQTLATVATIGADTLSSPHDVALDPAGRLLVADTGNHRVAIFALEGSGAQVSGRLVGALSDGLRSPEGVVAAPDGRVYVTSAGAGTVTVFRDGRVERRFGASGSGPLELSRPHDVDRDGAGRLWVVDSGNHRIQVFGPDFALLESLGGPGFAFNEPKYVSFDAAGNVYVADEYNSVVKVFDPRRRLLLTLRGAGESPFHQPEGVAVRGDTLWVADTYNHRIIRFTLHR